MKKHHVSRVNFNCSFFFDNILDARIHNFLLENCILILAEHENSWRIQNGFSSKRKCKRKRKRKRPVVSFSQYTTMLPLPFPPCLVPHCPLKSVFYIFNYFHYLPHQWLFSFRLTFSLQLYTTLIYFHLFWLSSLSLFCFILFFVLFTLASELCIWQEKCNF